jgi:hypothetical protein
MKGGIEVSSVLILSTVGMVLFFVGIILIIIHFSQFNVKVGLHDVERYANQLAENILTNCSLLYSQGIFNESMLDMVDNETEYCYRYCNIGSLIVIYDLNTSKVWKLGYKGGQTFTATFPVLIYNGTDFHEGRMDVIISYDITPKISCIADRAWIEGSAEINISSKELLTSSLKIYNKTYDYDENTYLMLCTDAIVPDIYDTEIGLTVESRCRKLYNTESFDNFERSWDGNATLRAVRIGDKITFNLIIH